VAKRYREKGLDKTAQLMVEFLEQRGIEGATVLEVGGGVGDIQIELLKRGAARAVNLELSPAYEEEATRLLREAGLEERAERLLHDIAADPADIVPADVVVLHRVVCCYPDRSSRRYEPASGKARRIPEDRIPPDLSTRETDQRAPGCETPLRSRAASRPRELDFSDHARVRQPWSPMAYFSMMVDVT
jgi:hypothetical protein